MSEPIRILTGIIHRDPRSKRRVLLLDGEPWRETSIDALRDIDLPIGERVCPSDIETTLASAEPQAARARALRLLESRERSAGELSRRLLDDGYPVDVVTGIVTSFERVEIIDDDRLATALVTLLLTRKRYGPRRIRSELLRRLIPEDTTDSALQSALVGLDEHDLAIAAARPLAATVREPERLARRLVRRGYSWDTALRAARTVIQDDFVDLA